MVPRFLQPNKRVPRLQKCGEHVENELVRRVRNGDVAAFEELFKLQQKRVYNIALRILGDEAEAADATQEVFVRAYQSIGKLNSDAAFVTWLKTMTINLCRDLLRRRPKARFESLDAPVESSDGDHAQREIADWSGNPEALLDAKQMRETVARAIDSLSPAYREVVTLFYIDGSDVAAIARIVGSPVGTVKCRLSRARAELKRKLETYIKG